MEQRNLGMYNVRFMEDETQVIGYGSASICSSLYTFYLLLLRSPVISSLSPLSVVSATVMKKPC